MFWSETGAGDRVYTEGVELSHDILFRQMASLRHLFQYRHIATLFYSVPTDWDTYGSFLNQKKRQLP